MLDLELGKKLSETSRDYANVCISSLKVSGGVHPPTVISACARMAGTHLFRSFDLRLDGVEPGQAVLSLEADQHSPMLLRTAAATLAQFGITIASAPTVPLVGGPIRPLQDFLTTQRLLEPRFAPIRAKHELSLRQSAQSSAIATATLIHHFIKHVDANTAFGLAVFGFIEGCKTAPDPVVQVDAGR